jgi:tripartite ATP-independent transporter DctM subunit
MSPEIIGLIGVILLVVLLFSGMYIAAVLALLGFIGIACIQGLGQAFSTLGTAPFQFISDYSFTVAPMFMLMGNIVSETGIGADLYYAMHQWLGRLRGGLAIATAGASGLFAAIVGDSMSGVIVFSKTAFPEMRKFKYSDALNTAVIAAGATIGILIPPSMGFVIYGILTEQSVGKLFMAGIIPGVLQVAFYAITIAIWCRIKPLAGPPGPKSTFKEKVVSIRKIWAAAALFLLVMGGIYAGVFTPTEGGAVGALGAIVIVIVSGRFRLKGFLNVLLETGLMTAMFMLIMSGAPIFMRFMAVSRLPFWLGDIITGLQVSPIVVMILIIIMYVILGTALPAIMTLILTLPIIYPLVVGLGFDPIWFGVICVRMAEIGDISPPEGLGVFVLSGLTGVSIWTIFKGLIPFLISDCFHVALLVAVPSLCLFLPNRMM